MNAPVQPIPEGSLLPLHGWKDTEVPDTVYRPSTPEGPVTTREDCAQLGYDSLAPHKVNAVEPPEYVAPVEAESSASGLIDCAAPWPPVDVFGRATGFTTYCPFTTPGVPTARTVVPDVEVPDTALLEAVSEPAPPDAVWALTDEADDDDGKRTL